MSDYGYSVNLPRDGGPASVGPPPAPPPAPAPPRVLKAAITVVGTQHLREPFVGVWSNRTPDVAGVLLGNLADDAGADPGVYGALLAVVCPHRLLALVRGTNLMPAASVVCPNGCVLIGYGAERPGPVGINIGDAPPSPTALPDGYERRVET